MLVKWYFISHNIVGICLDACKKIWIELYIYNAIILEQCPSGSWLQFLLPGYLLVSRLHVVEFINVMVFVFGLI
jgi:hypothetical protein